MILNRRLRQRISSHSLITPSRRWNKLSITVHCPVGYLNTYESFSLFCWARICTISPYRSYNECPVLIMCLTVLPWSSGNTFLQSIRETGIGWFLSRCILRYLQVADFRSTKMMDFLRFTKKLSISYLLSASKIFFPVLFETCPRAWVSRSSVPCCSP